MSVNPYQNLPENIGAFVKSKSHLSTEAWGLTMLSHIPVVQNATVGAVTGSSIEGLVVLPQACKIAKVAVAYGSVDTFNNSESFNIVVESAGDYNPAMSTPNANFNTTGTPFGQGVGVTDVAYTAGQLQTVGPGDNSGTVGYPTQFAAEGDCLFSEDVTFGNETFTNPSAGESGGSAVLPTTNWDTVYAAGTVLSLRCTTTASTGSITALCITLLAQTVDTRPANDRQIPCFCW